MGSTTATDPKAGNEDSAFSENEEQDLGIAERQDGQAEAASAAEKPEAASAAKKPQQDDAVSSSPKWKRFATDDRHVAFWWWCEFDDDSFMEDVPGGWHKFEDPHSKKAYWWLSAEKWFWEQSGRADKM